ncbi:1-acyl-sn-glycerol-3-phosphate acyltransferase [Jannaschia sp. S6380]|uniref:lysophospholipid acyltransferase family protein n=1 Tax=Jannaschia sp. S6380 TaxID=2926408 RepID=UPI001FF5E64A|nr:lysophospholipid acyltransferase family protein [Jannaschia sp. S6380]MCK0167623.1 1-acyl-sn-glycerol-3-phosphate acyltransferase [Jannaschia sp. S6380]
MQLIRSLAFNAAMYVWMLVLGIAFIPFALASPEGARRACDTYARTVLKMLAAMTGLRTEVRGTPPQGAVLVAAKHQSFLDILLIWSALPRPFFVMKSILRYAPILGQYAMRLGCIPVQRGKRAEAIKAMLAEMRSGRRAGGQLLIYPQGTRVAPGARRPYKVGTFAMYEQLGQPCVPVATNVGVFWPKRGALRKPGLAVAEFLEPIPPGLNRATFMDILETRIETASNRLMEEAGFPVSRGAQHMADPLTEAARGVARPKP